MLLTLRRHVLEQQLLILTRQARAYAHVHDDRSGNTLQMLIGGK